uniref:Uncharacterized protein n=1 Tax=mine drainage metagenome TaxID=410659 RepID=E6QAP4_9ZZZZ
MLSPKPIQSAITRRCLPSTQFFKTPPNHPICCFIQDRIYHLGICSTWQQVSRHRADTYRHAF